MDLDLAARLLSPDGRALVARAREIRALPPHRRVLALRGSGPGDLARAALLQDDLRQRAAPRCPFAEDLWLLPEALEQATAWPVAAERAGRWPRPDGSLVDLTAGLGFDALAAALAGRAVVAFERDPVRALLLRENARTLGVEERLEVREEDVLRAPLPAAEHAFLDPDRRAGGRRSRDPDDFAPPRSEWARLLAPFAAAMVKLPPVAAPPRPGGEAGAEPPLEVVSLDGRARERRWRSGDWGPLPARRALALPSGAFVEGPGIPWPSPARAREGDLLLDPDPAVTLAGLVGDLALPHGLRPVHPRIAYLLGRDPVPGAPGHAVRIEAVLPPRPREVDRWLAARRIGRLTIRTRGVADDAAAWRRRLHPRGSEEGTLVVTRGVDDRWVVLGGREVTPAP